jgi:hypothetical protein
MSHESSSFPAADSGASGRAIGWHAVDGCAPDWLSDDAPNWAALDRDPRATLVKESETRQVWRVAIRDQVLFVKVFLGKSLPHRVWRWLQISPEQKEWRVGRYAARFDIGCVRLIAFLRPIGTTHVKAVLISEEAPAATSLADAWNNARDLATRARRHRLAHLNQLVARLLVHAHRNRFRHRDLHPANILICHDADGQPQRALFVDLQRARVGQPVRSSHIATDLAQLSQWFMERARAGDRLRFLQAYLRAGEDEGDKVMAPRDPVGYRAWIRRIETARRRHARSLYQHRDRRIFRQNRYFGSVDLGRGWRGRFTLRFRRRDVPPCPSQPDRSLADWADWVRKEMPDPADAQRCEHAAPALGVRIVRHAAQTLGERLVWAVRGSPGRRMYRDGHRQRNRDEPVASPIALLERRHHGLVIESLVLVERESRGAE